MKKVVLSLVLSMIVTCFAHALGAQGSIPRRADGTPIFQTEVIHLTQRDWAEPSYTWQQVKDARLYFTTDNGQSWKPTDHKLNPPDGIHQVPYFEFYSQGDGDYGFNFALPGASVPLPGVRPHDQKVFIDTTAPSMKIVSPDGSTVAKSGQDLTIVYESDDANPARDQGLWIEYSINGGKTWQPIVENAPNVGSYIWRPVVEDTVQTLIRVSAADIVGNKMQTPVITQVPFTIEGPDREEPVDPRDETEEDEVFIQVVGPKYGKIYFEHTDFYYRVTNKTKSPTKIVRVWYSMDNGQTWQVGGANRTGSNEDKVSVYFHKGFRRHGAFGNYQAIDFYYQVVTVDNIKNAPDPAETATHFSMDRYHVDVEGPSLAVYSPAFDDVMYRGQVPNNSESGKYFIEWDGADRNLVPHVTMAGYESGPVEIYYTSNPDDEEPLWTLLADRLPIDGRFVKFNDLPLGRTRIKLVATDQMNNTSARYTGIFEVRDGTGYAKPTRPLNGLEIDRLWTQATQLHSNGRYREAVEMYDHALAIAVDVAKERADALYHDKAVSLYADGRVEDAKNLLDGVVGRNPDGLKYRYTLASLYLKTGDNEHAQAQCEEIIKRDDIEPHVAARAMLASIYFQDGLTVKAENLWKTVVEHGSPASADYKEAKAQLAAIKERRTK